MLFCDIEFFVVKFYKFVSWGYLVDYVYNGLD